MCVYRDTGRENKNKNKIEVFLSLALSPQMAVADITKFDITYKDVMAPIGYKRVMCGMDTSVGGDITRGLQGAFPTFIWTEHGDSDQCVEEIDIIYDNEEPPPGYIKVENDLVGGLERQCYLCYKLIDSGGGYDSGSSGGNSEEKRKESKNNGGGGGGTSDTTATTTTSNVLPLCSIKICYSAEHDLAGEGYTRLDKNILSGVGEAYIHYRRRQPSDRLKWSAKRLEIGDLLDAKDTVNKWCFACVIEKDPYRRPGEIKVHFTRWEGDRYDAWYNVSSPKLAEYGTRSKEETNIIPGKQWNTTIEIIDTKMNKLENVRNNMYKLDEYLEKQLSVYVARCTGYNVYPKDDTVIPKIYEMFKLVVEILADQINNHGEINEKLLILGVTVLYADEQVNYFFQHEGYIQSSGGMMGSLFGGSTSSHDIVENAPAEDYIRTRGRKGHNDSKYYGALFNLFGSTGVFDSILRRLTSKDSQDGLSMNMLEYIVKILTKPYKWYVLKFQEDFFPKFQIAVFDRLSQLNNNELQKLDRQKLDRILSLVEKLLLETIDNFSGDEMLEKFQLQLSKTLLTCQYLNKRLLGVELLIEWIQRSERKDRRRSATANDDYGETKYGGSGGSSGGGSSSRTTTQPKAKWLDIKTLSNWITEHEIFNTIMDENTSHPSIIQKAMTRHGGDNRRRRGHRNNNVRNLPTSLLQFLAKMQTKSKLSIDDSNSPLTRHMLNLLWKNALSDNQMTSNSCVESIGDASEEFGTQVFSFFNEKIATFPIERSTETWIQMFGALVTSSRKHTKESSSGNSGSWGFGFSTPTKSKKNSSSKIDVNIVLDKLFDIVFAARGIRIEQDAVNAAHGCLLTALKSNNNILQHYLSKMMNNVEQGLHIDACMTMMSGLLPLLSGGRLDDGPTGTTPAAKQQLSKEDEENASKLFQLHTTIVQLIVNASNPSRCSRLLDFLRNVCLHGRIQLSFETVRILWQPMTKRGTEYSTELFKWLVKHGDQLVESTAMEDIYLSLVLPRMESPGHENDSIFLFHVFSKMFDIINAKKELLRDGKAMTLELSGMESLWSFLSSDTSNISLNMCVKKFILLVLNMHPKAYDGDKKKGWNEFIEKCMKIMSTTNDDATLQSVLLLLSRFLDEVKNKKLPYDSSNPGMLMNAQLKVEWGKSKWFNCEVDNFDGHKGLHHTTYTDGDARWYQINSKSVRGNSSNTYSSDAADVWLNNAKGSHKANIIRWDPKCVRNIQEEVSWRWRRNSGIYFIFSHFLIDQKRYPFLSIPYLL